MNSEFEKYRDYLRRLPISGHTRRNYLLRVRQYLLWLQDVPDGVKALVDPVDRDFAVQEYKAVLLRKGMTANSLNSVLAAIDNFYMSLGLGPAKVKRQEIPNQAPRALEPEEYRRLLKVIARSSCSRNRSIALIMLFCGLRISEVSQLNIGDVLLAARKRELIVRCGKGTKRRIVPINSELADNLQTYFLEVKSQGTETPLFVSQKGNRLSVQAIDSVIRQFGRDAGVDFSSHCLRHTCLTRLVRAGVDIVTVAEIAGHARLETSRRYSLPTEAVKAAAMEKLVNDSTST